MNKYKLKFINNEDGIIILKKIKRKNFLIIFIIICLIAILVILIIKRNSKYMEVDSSGKNFIIKHETDPNKDICEVYYDIANNLTVGYGHKVLPNYNLKNNEIISKYKVEKFFIKDLNIAEDGLNSHPNVRKLSQAQYNASVDFLYNLGTEIVYDSNSNFYKALNNDDIYKNPISNQAKKILIEGFTYTLCNGERNKGLVNRRNDELNLFLGTKGINYIPYEK